MYPAPFRYERPDTLEQALRLLREHGEEARPLAGGQSLIPLMKLRVVYPEVLIDLQDLPGGRSLTVGDDVIEFGPLTRHVDIERSPEVADRAPILTEAMRWLADVQVRTLGTVAGSLAEADPGGDWGPLALALGGEVVSQRVSGKRVIPHDQLFVDYLTSAVEEDELITAIRLRTPPSLRSGGAYVKLERRAGDFAVVAVAAQVELDDAGHCISVGIGLGGVALLPIKPVALERALLGTSLDDRTVAEASGLIDECIAPISDGRGPDWYKRDMVKTYAIRAVKLAAARARAGTGATP